MAGGIGDEDRKGGEGEEERLARRLGVFSIFFFAMGKELSGDEGS